MKRFVCFMLSLVMSATLLAGCGSNSTTVEENNAGRTNEKEKVVVACLVVGAGFASAAERLLSHWPPAIISASSLSLARSIYPFMLS